MLALKDSEVALLQHIKQVLKKTV